MPGTEPWLYDIFHDFSVPPGECQISIVKRAMAATFWSYDADISSTEETKHHPTEGYVFSFTLQPFYNRQPLEERLDRPQDRPGFG
jgi:hypothetical protein